MHGWTSPGRPIYRRPEIRQYPLSENKTSRELAFLPSLALTLSYGPQRAKRLKASVFGECRALDLRALRYLPYCYNSTLVFSSILGTSEVSASLSLRFRCGEAPYQRYS